MVNKVPLQYTNPVLPGFYPDPSITRAGDDYYLVCSSFEYFPGVPVFHSRDLIHWKQIGHVLDRISQLDIRSCGSSDGIYAPAIRYHAGIFYMITTDVRGRGNFYVTAADPAGPWSDPVAVPYGGIDPSLMFDDDGRVYVTAQQGAGYDSHIIQYEIDAATGTALSEPVVIWTGDGGPWLEGPHLYKINGLYYIMAASGGTAKEHREIIGRSTSPYGPFEQLPEPILTHRGIEHPIQYLGHADLIEGPGGNWWAVFLGVRLTDQGYSVLGRETFLAPVNWTEDGWPVIDNNEGVVALQMEVPEGSDWWPMPVKEGGSRLEFDTGELPFELTFLRNPAEGSWSLDERPGWLALRGQPCGINGIGQTAFIGRRQQHVCAQWSTLLEFVPGSESEQAGLCARMNERAHYEICLAVRDGHNVVAAYLTVKGETQPVAEVPVNVNKVYLKIKTDPDKYSLLYSLDGVEWILLAAGPAYALSPQAVEGNGFTGVVTGMYAAGQGAASQAVAYFDWLEYKTL
ncbi:glycoside hydrolase 43 family protein [Paenibacillus sp. PK3_47]|uniref:glycoside hydrolase family 43 protein n=1 Tax=Paenibacillus sp. PK3_47 TaxID=2072642 RepID=UPI00201D9F8B|nr:glycoside hydrolase family 43 protein [Paenibacillus sp. PK3_47]UQZ33483.1 glycoside hydrolase 43 family protein [Paenibacillus sp. PK3_47]